MSPGSGVHELGFSAYGVQARLRVEGMDEIEPVLAALPPHLELEPPGDADLAFGLLAGGAGRFAVEEDGTRLAEALPLEIALDVLERRIRTAVALRAPELIFVHAGVVARRGRALLLPGPSFAGKSSLVAALVRAGALYYSDEYAVLDRDGRVLPYARPLAIRTGRAHDAVPVERLRGVAGRDAVEVGAVIVTEYRQDAVWDPRPMSEGDAVLAMVRNTVPAQARPAESLRAATQAVRGARLCRGARPDAALVAPQLLPLLD